MRVQWWPAPASEVVDEAYKDFVVPDDLMW